MNCQLMLLAVIAAVYSVAEGLKCRTCHLVEAHSDNSLFNEFYTKPSDTSCRDSVDTVEEEVCESEQHVFCGKATASGTGTRDTDRGKITVTYKTIARGCSELGLDAIGCHDINEFPKTVKAIQMISEASFKIDATYEGRACFCDSDNCNSAPGGRKAVTLAVFVLAALTTILI